MGPFVQLWFQSNDHFTTISKLTNALETMMNGFMRGANSERERERESAECREREREG